MRRFEEKEWTFLNINSPADLWADYREDGAVRVKEYDRCRNGHFLISEFWVDQDALELEIGVERADDGVVAGVYFGEGGYDRFWQTRITRGGISVQRPSGVPLGDTFRYEGALRLETLAEVTCEVEFPAIIRVVKKREVLRVSVDGKLCLCCKIAGKGEECKASRILLGAVNLGSSAERETTFSAWNVSEICSFPSVWGKLVDETGKNMAGYSVHLCGMRDRWTYTDEEGVFYLDNLPCGSYRGVAGAVGGEYRKLQMLCDGKQLHISNMKPEYSAEKGIFEEVTSECTKINLNGIWSFDWDKEVQGEKEKWYERDRHCFSKVIRVPFSFHSLEAFGEGVLADDENLYQAANWYVNLKETGNYAWYQRIITVPESGEWELVFGAVCGYAKIWINNICIGCTVDSYERFRFGMGDLKCGQEYTITVCVNYPVKDMESCRGKQDFWFHASPGIWQTVWMEKVQKIRAEDILVEYCFEKERGALKSEKDPVSIQGEVFWDIRGETRYQPDIIQQGDEVSCVLPEGQGIYRLVFEYEAEQTEKITMQLKEKALYCSEWDATGKSGYWDKKVCYIKLTGNTELRLKGWKHFFEVKKVWLEPIELPKKVRIKPELSAVDDTFIFTEGGRLKTCFTITLPTVRRWDPKHPFLYELTLYVYGKMQDVAVFRRKIGFRDVKAEKYISVNGKDVYVRGVLDQGYNPWGIYTYLSEYEKSFSEKHRAGKGTMEYDIRKAKEYGYNLIRMHIKDNEPAWYQICDETGMLVWDEHPLNFYAKWENGKWRGMYYRRLKDMIRKQNYHPSIVLYSTFNESWGIMGGHELSAWEIEGGQRWQKSMAGYFHKNGGNVLLVDNSGYAKTGETDILDYHMYPDEFEDAKSFFARLERENYVGSSFNCYHYRNKEQMQDEKRRELLQRNCRLDLQNLNYVGEEVQHGQPVLVSEFVHTGRLDQMVRSFAGIAGYIRMNLASQENEDTSPLSAVRRERDFGYRHYDFSGAEYGYINGENLVWPDIPVLSKRQAKESVEIPIYVRIWEHGKTLRLYIYESRIDFRGDESIPKLLRKETFEYKEKEPVRLPTYVYSVPEKCRAVQLFFVVKEETRIVAENDIRFEVFDETDREPEWSVSHPLAVKTEESQGCLYEGAGRDGYYLYGNGVVEWKFPCPAGIRTGQDKRYMLRMEMSTCECATGTRITDENRYSGYVTVELNGNRKVKIFLEDHPWDEKAVFSNSGCSDEQSVPYKKWGKYGYGFRKEISLFPEEVEEMIESGYLHVRICTEDTGVIIYGRRMGRYGAEPMIIEDAGRSKQR